jgi:hypothetical protein
MSLHKSVEKLKALLFSYPDILAKISPEILTQKPAPDKWSKQEILGHLIDSAANNHQRFIRIQSEIEPVIFYDQNKWNDLSNYNANDKTQLIQFWLLYNQHLMHIIKSIPPDNLDLKGSGRDGRQHTLEWYIVDYIDHLEHHLKQITQYNKISATSL